MRFLLATLGCGFLLITTVGIADAATNSYDPATQTLTTTLGSGDLQDQGDLGSVVLVEPRWQESFIGPPGISVCCEPGIYPDVAHIVIRSAVRAMIHLDRPNLYTNAFAHKMTLDLDFTGAANTSQVKLDYGDLDIPANITAHANGLDLDADGVDDVTFDQPQLQQLLLTTGTRTSDTVDLRDLALDLTECNTPQHLHYGFTYYSEGAGNDTVLGPRHTCTSISIAGGSLTATTGTANDEIYAKYATWTRLSTGPGNDALRLGAGNDTADTGPGNDGVDGGSGNDVVHLGAGNDGAFHLGAGAFHAWGGKGNDDLMGGAHSHNFLFGEKGNDFLRGIRNPWSRKHDHWDCGPGHDTAFYPINHMHHCETVEFPNK